MSSMEAAVGLEEPRAALRLDRNLALMAGAGAGKTHALVTLCLQLLGGVRGEPLKCAELCLVTFTDKAAAELRARLRERLDALAGGGGASEGADALEPDVAAALSQAGVAFPAPSVWRRHRDELGSALIGTFHSLCMQLLKRAPPEFGLEPGFRLLDERESTELLGRVVEEVVLGALEAGTVEVARLCQAFSFRGEGRGQGLVEAVGAVLTRCREEGFSPAALAVTDEGAARSALEQALAATRTAVSGALAALAQDAKRQEKYGASLAQCEAALSALATQPFLSSGAFPRLEQAVLAEVGWSRAKVEELKEVRRRVLGDSETSEAGALPGLRDFYGAVEAAPYERAFRALVVQAEARHRAELARQGVLDFTGLLSSARDLLRDQPGFRAEVQRRLKALLVDEFQDTNHLQLEVVTLLAERRDGAPRAVAQEEVSQLPLEPALLCAVGDRKQSIYEFRGADVAVFGALAERLEAQGGARHYLKQNRRSLPSLIGFFNALFARVLEAPAQGARPFEVAYVPSGDDMVAVREESAVQEGAPALPRVQRLVQAVPKGAAAEVLRQVEADAVARLLEGLLSPQGPACVVDEGGPRRALGRDVAILFRRFTHLEVYRQALARRGIPHRVVRGRGFYGAQEVLDVAALLALIGDAHDALALAAVLRSPLVGLSDASLLALTRTPEGKGRSLASALHRDEASAPLPEQERERWERFRALHRRLHAERDRLGVEALLRVALDETGYRVTLAGTPYGEQALANLDKLSMMAARWDAKGQGQAGAFARELARLVELAPTEAQADVVEASDPRAVQLLTIHQSKGLQWPVVFVPELGAEPSSETGRVLMSRSIGLAMRPPVDDEVNPPRYRELAAERRRRARAEHGRLFYVAATRARDGLVLSGPTAKARSTTWWRLLDEALASDAQLRALVTDVDADALVAAPPVASMASAAGEGPLEASQGPAAAHAEALVAEAEARARRRPETRAGAMVLPVTALQDFVLCPRRYRFVHELGLPEFFHGLEARGGLGARSGQAGDADDVSDEADSLDGPGDEVASSRRRRGTVAHRVLERFPWETLKAERSSSAVAAVRELLWQENVEPDSREGQEVAKWVGGFVAGPLGARLARLSAEGRVFRELPFLLRLESPPAESSRREAGLARAGLTLVGKGSAAPVGAAGPTAHLKGQIDLLYLDDDRTAVVLDYKSGPRPKEGAQAYRFQLQCYALAARRWLEQRSSGAAATGTAATGTAATGTAATGTAKVKAGIVFLREPGRGPEFLAESRERLVAESDGAASEASLVSQAQALWCCSTRGEWTGRERSVCAAQGCGYLYRCHPRERPDGE